MNRFVFGLLLSSVSLIATQAHASDNPFNNNNNEPPRIEAAAPVHPNMVVNPIDRKDWVQLMNKATYNRENPAETKPLNVWSFDGGGIIGILAAHSYAVADQVAKALTGQSIHNFIDVYAGTSTGGIFAAAATLAGPNGESKLNAIELFRLYRYYGANIFKKVMFNHVNLGGVAGVKYDAKYLEDLLQHFCKDEQGKQPKFIDCTRPTFITSYSTNSDKGVLFDSTNKDQVRGLETCKVARATSAAPTYFNPVTLQVGDKDETLVDGGVWENDPSLKTLETLAEKYDQVYDQMNKKDVSVVRLISFGAGFVKLNATEDALKDVGALKVLGPLLVSLFNSREKGVEQSNKVAKRMANKQLEHNRFGVVLQDYERFQIELKDDVKALDNVSPAALELLVQKSSNQCRSDQFVEMLARVLGKNADAVRAVLEQAITDVDVQAKTVNFDANHYYDHLAWVLEFILTKQDKPSFDPTVFLNEKLGLKENLTAEELRTRANWLSHFMLHNLKHNNEKTYYSAGTEIVLASNHMTLQKAALNIYCDLTAKIFAQDQNQDICFDSIADNQMTMLREVFNQSTNLNGYMSIYQEMIDMSIILADTLPAAKKISYLNKLKTVVQHSGSKRSYVSWIKEMFSDSWHGEKIKKIDEKIKV